MTRSWQDALGVPHPPTDTLAAVPQTGPVTTVIEPVLLLPAAKAWRASRNEDDNVCRNVFRHCYVVGEHRVEPCRRGTVRYAPRAQALLHLVHGIDRACVDEPAGLPATAAAGLGGLDNAVLQCIRVVRKLRQRFGHRMIMTTSLGRHCETLAQATPRSP